MIKGNDTVDKLSKFSFSHIISDYSVCLREEITTKDNEHVQFYYTIELHNSIYNCKVSEVIS